MESDPPRSRPGQGASDFDRQRRLFDLACELPPVEREACVRREAADDASLCERVLRLLELAETGTLNADAGASTATRTDAGERVQSTATDELLTRLTEAPRLDTTRYEFDGEVDRGGMGRILRVRDRHLGRWLAMKALLARATPNDAYEEQLARQLLGRFLEEAQITSQLDHPGVVPVHELGLDADGEVWFTMRLVKGRSAHEVFADAHAGRNDWTTTRALEVILKVCDTVAFAHAKGVLHRDLKPGNVMVGRFGEVYVMDWGLAKVHGQKDGRDLRIRPEQATAISRVDSVRRRDADAHAASSVVSMDGQKLGTPSYMPPEQARSEPLDERADVYAIGAMLYELLAGRPPFTTPGVPVDAYRVLERVVQGPPEAVDSIRSDVPPELVAIVERAMARDRERRYRTTRELAADLRAFIEHRAVQAYRTGALVELRLWIRRNKPLATSLACAAMFLIVGVVVASVLADRNAALATEYQRLTDDRTLSYLESDYDDMWPAAPTMVRRYETWLENAQRITGSQAHYAAGLARAEAEEAQRDFRWTPEFSVRKEIFRRLVHGTTELPPKAANVELRLGFARDVEQRTISDYRAVWNAVIGDLRGKLYGGAALTPQLGLVPLGKDRKSGHHEFALLQTGTVPSRDDVSGELQITEESAIVLVLLPGGPFTMGSPVDEPGREDTEDQARITLRPFLLGKHEVTQAQWLRIMDQNPSSGRPGNQLEGISTTLLHPVENVSWDDCVEFVRRLGLELPSEAQWEYGCRAGTATAYAFGPTVDSLREAGVNLCDACFADLSNTPVANAVSWRDGYPMHGPVTAFRPNGFGLVGMVGNVSEWCRDPWMSHRRDLPDIGDGIDDSVVETRRVFRGGNWFFGFPKCRSAFREPHPPTSVLAARGLRVARALL